MYLFDGKEFAHQLEMQLGRDLTTLKQSKKLIPSIHSIVFNQDNGGLLYARLKAEAAARVGMKYTQHKYNYTDDKKLIIDHIKKLNFDPECTAILIQKPRRREWVNLTGRQPAEFGSWWRDLVTSINPAKDVDGLVADYSRLKIWPATAWAVWLIMNQASQILNRPLTQEKIAIVGASDLLGLPLHALLISQTMVAQLLTHQDFDDLVNRGVGLTDFSLVVSATGQPGLITGDMLADDSVAIDVGEPKPDFDLTSISSKVSFFTPVPGGVGPVTVVCLLQNAVELVKNVDT